MYLLQLFHWPFYCLYIKRLLFATGGVLCIILQYNSIFKFSYCVLILYCKRFTMKVSSISYSLIITIVLYYSIIFVVIIVTHFSSTIEILGFLLSSYIIPNSIIYSYGSLVLSFSTLCVNFIDRHVLLSSVLG